MRIPMLQVLRTAVMAGALSLAVHAQVFLKFEDVNLAIPDGDLIGVVDAHEVSGLSDVGMVSVQVWLALSGTGEGGYTGDLHLALWHGGERAVLLNRPGRTATSASGYSDSGDMNITLAATASGDLHVYREILGDPGTPLAGPLAGTWQPDGRATDPLEVVDTDSRTSGLGVFEGMDPNGIWALLAIDAGTGGTVQVDGWGLVITSVPEPTAVGAAVAGCLLGWAMLRKRRSHGLFHRPRGRDAGER